MTSRINIPNRQPPAATPSYQPPPPSYSTRPSAHGRNSSQMAGLAQSFGIDNDAIQQVRGYTSKVEDAIETIGRPLKPYLPAAARSVTFSSCSHSRLSVFSSLHAWYTGNGCIFHSGLDLVELCWARPASRPGARPFSNRSASEQPASLDVDAGSAACGLSHHASYKRHHPLLLRPPSLSPILEGRSTPRRPARAASKVSRSLPRLPGGARRGDKERLAADPRMLRCPMCHHIDRRRACMGGILRLTTTVKKTTIPVYLLRGQLIQEAPLE